MKFKAVLFDLDGTLLPMDLDEFTKQYFGAIAKHLAPHGFEPNATIDAILKGSYAMVKNNGEKTNEQAIWEYFEGRMGKVDRALFDAFYLEKAPIAPPVIPPIIAPGIPPKTAPVAAPLIAPPSIPTN